VSKSFGICWSVYSQQDCFTYGVEADLYASFLVSRGMRCFSEAVVLRFGITATNLSRQRWLRDAIALSPPPEAEHMRYYFHIRDGGHLSMNRVWN
jgi:hypothetical protein